VSLEMQAGGAINSIRESSSSAKITRKKFQAKATRARK